MYVICKSNLFHKVLDVMKLKQKKYHEQCEYFLKHPYLLELVIQFILKKIIRVCEDLVGFRIFIIDTQL